MEYVILKIVLGKNHKYIYNNIMNFKCLMKYNEFHYSLILIFILMLFMIINQEIKQI